MKLSNQRPRARNLRLRDSEDVWGPRALLRLSPESAGEREQNHEKISTSRRMAPGYCPEGKLPTSNPMVAQSRTRSRTGVELAITVGPVPGKGGWLGASSTVRPGLGFAATTQGLCPQQTASGDDCLRSKRRRPGDEPSKLLTGKLLFLTTLL